MLAHLEYIRQVYERLLPSIIKNYPRTDPYFIDWFSIFTPIEHNVWNDIRCLGLPMYPQFPVKGYFVDFGDPVKKIAIEADGKRWHTDVERDKERQEHIEQEGWTVYRIEGRQTYLRPQNPRERPRPTDRELKKMFKEYGEEAIFWYALDYSEDILKIIKFAHY